MRSRASPSIDSHTLSKFVSEADHRIVARPRSLAFAVGSEIDAVGCVLSIVTEIALDAVLPALSVTLNVAVYAPSAIGPVFTASDVSRLR